MIDVKLKKPVVGITIGDINGIGLEIIIKSFTDKRILDLCTPVIFGSAQIASTHRKACNIQNFNFKFVDNINDISHKQINLLNCWKEEVNVTFGENTIESGKYALLSLESAVKHIKNNTIDFIVTAPINKLSIQKIDESFIGHTEFFEKKFNGNSLMMMVNNNLRISCITSLLPLKKVCENISISSIISKVLVMNQSLIKDFKIQKPKIAILGLNPHAGEYGMLGSEEKEIIIPAIQRLKEEENILSFGPYPADSFFSSKKIKDFDGVVAMYHDQGLIPFKSLSFSEGVNYTSGISIIRTSPSHGTGYDIAGKNIADESSFRSSVFLGCQLFKDRKLYEELNKNPI